MNQRQGHLHHWSSKRWPHFHRNSPGDQMIGGFSSESSRVLSSQRYIIAADSFVCYVMLIWYMVAIDVFVIQSHKRFPFESGHHPMVISKYSRHRIHKRNITIPWGKSRRVEVCWSNIFGSKLNCDTFHHEMDPFTGIKRERERHDRWMFEERNDKKRKEFQ